jgi:prepilin-type N-terminal cleavage/methylation domain-containing protein
MRFSKIQLSKRTGFTLLEVLLASMIAVLLFGGLYVAMDVELRQANEGREAIERSTVSRAIINRIALDVAPSLTPPRASPQPTGASSTSSSTTGATSSSSASSSSATSSASSSSSSTTGSNSPPTSVGSTPSAPIPLAGGVIGYTDSIIIFTSRVPDPNYVPVNSTDPVPSDIRRISYWLGSNGGLCRQEIPWFSNDTFQMANSITYETGKTDDDYMIAPEVESLQFQYFDINTIPTGGDGDWADNWDGTQPGPDGMTPYGPPTAIRITFTLSLTDSIGKTESKAYQHVIPLITSNGPNVAASGSTATGQ